MSLPDVIKWDGREDTFAIKHRTRDFTTFTQLIVQHTQEAFFQKEGKLLGPFRAGRHTLSTKNFPVLGRFFKLAFSGHKTPFTADLFFVDNTIKLDVPWGFEKPIQIEDPKYKIMIPVFAEGQFGITIGDTKRLLTKFVGSMDDFTYSKLQSYLRGIILTEAKTVIADTMLERQVDIYKVATQLSVLSDAIESVIKARLLQWGIELSNFQVAHIDTDWDDPSVIKLRDATATQASYSVLKTDYTQARSLDILQDAAGNEGSAGDIMGAGIGLGVGAGLGGAIGQNAGGIGGSMNVSGGNKGTTCNECGALVANNENFCPRCGDAVLRCPSCGTDNAESAVSCSQCGITLVQPKACVFCDKSMPEASKFCPHCGQPQLSSCSECEAEIPPKSKFCNECGAAQK